MSSTVIAIAWEYDLGMTAYEPVESPGDLFGTDPTYPDIVGAETWESASDNNRYRMYNREALTFRTEYDPTSRTFEENGLLPITCRHDGADKTVTFKLTPTVGESLLQLPLFRTQMLQKLVIADTEVYFFIHQHHFPWTFDYKVTVLEESITSEFTNVADAKVSITNSKVGNYLKDNPDKEVTIRLEIEASRPNYPAQDIPYPYLIDYMLGQHDRDEASIARLYFRPFRTDLIGRNITLTVHVPHPTIDRERVSYSASVEVQRHHGRPMIDLSKYMVSGKSMAHWATKDIFPSIEIDTQGIPVASPHTEPYVLQGKVYDTTVKGRVKYAKDLQPDTTIIDTVESVKNSTITKFVLK